MAEADLDQARVVIIGGGVVGASCLYHLARAGWTDALLLERNELTAGSTWHAAGNIPNFSGNAAVLRLQAYSTALYRGIADAVGYPINYNVSGAVRLAHSMDRMREFEHVAAMARTIGVEMEMMTPEEMRAAHPFAETHDLAGALWDPHDGDMDPAQITQAFAKGARDLGARVRRFTPATGVRQIADGWIVDTDSGPIRCEKVVNAAGYYAGRVGEWFVPCGGRPVPMAVMSHQYLLTEEIAEIAAWTAEHGRKLPLLRDVDSSYYLRQEKSGLNLGPYEVGGRAHWQGGSDPMPDDFSFQLFPDDLDRLEWYIEDAMGRVPVLGETGINKVINGPIPYAPDGFPLLGPMPGVANAFEACVFTFGIAQAGGAGKILTEWLTEGETEWDCWAVDPRRFTAHADPAYCRDRAIETYGHEYAMHFPRHIWPAARNRKTSAAHEALVAEGAQMMPFNGWERAAWFAGSGDDTTEASSETWARGPSDRAVRAECGAVRDGTGVLSLSGFTRFRVHGDGAAAALDGLVAGALPGVGRLTLAYVADARGRCLTEFSMIRDDDDDVTLITAAAAQWHDRDLLRAHLPDSVTLEDVTEATEALLVTGPTSRGVLAPLTDGDLSSGWLTHQMAAVCGHPVRLARVSFAGELGWEIHAAPDAMPDIYEAVRDGGAVPFGMFALDSLRIEKTYRAWKSDLSSDYTLLELGLERFLRLGKAAAFPGKPALQAEAASGPARRLVPLVLDDVGDTDPPPMAPVHDGDECVGAVTTAAFGARVGKAIALAMLDVGRTAPGTRLEIASLGTRIGAEVQPDRPLWDPENKRLRA